MSEAEGVSKSFDPRFSRAFQPGYDARVHREEPPAALQRDEPSADQVGASGHLDGSPTFAVPEPTSSVSDAAGRTAQLERDEGDELYARVWWRRVNPWFIVLWVLGVAFILAGLGLVQLASAMSEPSAQIGFQGFFFSMLYQMAWIGTPMLVILGLATLTSTVVIQAARWQSR